LFTFPQAAHTVTMSNRAKKSGIGYAVEKKMEDVSIFDKYICFCYAQIVYIIFWIQDVWKRSC